jgi:hypothetical protein
MAQIIALSRISFSKECTLHGRIAAADASGG